MLRALKRAPLRTLPFGLLLWVTACGPDGSETGLAPAEELLGTQESALCSGVSVTSVTLDGFDIYEGVGAGSGRWTVSTGANAARVEYYLNGSLVAFEEREADLGSSPASGPWYFSQSPMSCGAMYTFTVKAYPMVIDSFENRTTCFASYASLSKSTSQPCPSQSTAPSRLDVFARGTNGSVYQRYYQSDLNWSVWGSLGAPSAGAVGDPAAVSWARNRIDLFVRGGDNALWHRWWDGSWSAWQSLGGVLSSGPDVSSWGSGRLDVFAKGSTGSIHHKYYQSGSGWSGWSSLGEPSVGAVGDPSAVSWGSNRIDLFVRGGDNALWHKAWGGSSWSAWQSLGGALSSAPDVASWGSGHLDVFARGTDNTVWHKWYSISGWSDWSSVGAPEGGATSSPGAVSPGSGYIDLVVRGADNAIWRRSYNGAWSEKWQLLGGALISGPDAASWSN